MIDSNSQNPTSIFCGTDGKLQAFLNQLTDWHIEVTSSRLLQHVVSLAAGTCGTAKTVISTLGFVGLKLVGVKFHHLLGATSITSTIAFLEKWFGSNILFQCSARPARNASATPLYLTRLHDRLFFAKPCPRLEGFSLFH